MAKAAWLYAGELNGTHLDTDVRIMITDDETKVTAVFTGNLREINHHGATTVLRIGEQGAKELVLDTEHPVVLNPYDDYSDDRMFTGKKLDEEDRHA